MIGHRSRRDHRFVAPRKQKCIGSPVGRCSIGDPGIVSLCFYKQVCFITHNTDAVRNAAISMNKTGLPITRVAPIGAMKKSHVFVRLQSGGPYGTGRWVGIQTGVVPIGAMKKSYVFVRATKRWSLRDRGRSGAMVFMIQIPGFQFPEEQLQSFSFFFRKTVADVFRIVSSQVIRGARVSCHHFGYA